MNETIRTWGPVAVVVALLPVAFVGLRGCVEPIGAEDASSAGPAVEPEAATGSLRCRRCHETEHAAWTTSTHARAEQELGEAHRVPLREGRLEVTTADGVEAVEPVRVIGVEPLWQYLVPVGAGRLQVTQIAWDPARAELFDVFADGRQPGEWGHWTGGGMNWNAQCASCHDTGVSKGLEIGVDGRPAYDTEVAEHGVGCEACHGEASTHVSGGASPEVPDGRWLDVCGSCHARRAELTGSFEAGDALLDHFRPALVDTTDAFYADGQVRDEDFEYTAFIGSRMHEAGVSCVACHEPHSGGLQRDGDALCEGCHVPLGLVPHDRHDGAVSCVGCHMPVTTYMRVDPRHDHGFVVPDPGIDGVPDVCTRCHADQTVAWASRAADAWWPERRSDRRTRAERMAAARRGDRAAIPGLIEQLRGGTTAWRASAAAALGGFAREDEVTRALLAALDDDAALVRMSATEALAAVADGPVVQKALASRLADGRRAVRVAAARSLRHRLSPQSAEAADYDRYLEHNGDQPGALLDGAGWDLARGDARRAVGRLTRAIELDPGSPALHEQIAVAWAQLGQADAAVEALQAAMVAGSDDADLWYRLGLAHHGAGDRGAAEAALREAVRRDPAHPRAGYNLAVLLAESGKVNEALQTLDEAAQHHPDSTEIRSAIRHFRDRASTAP